MLLSSTLLFLLLSLNIVIAIPTGTSSPSVTLDDATFTGVRSGEVSEFLGIPFAQPPTGNLRFRLPRPIVRYHARDSKSATSFGFSCIQQSGNTPPIEVLPNTTIAFIENAVGSSATLATSEDCLTVNVVTPANVTDESKLPVVLWIYGGSFQIGSSSIYDGSSIVTRSLALNEPVIYVSINYRLSAFGFLASQEVKEAKVGNLGLHDQREGMRWVQKYIEHFGGDPSKVTIWGDSAGSISVGLHMVANNGQNEGLFRAAFMQSGSPIPIGDITNGQPYFDALVSQTGCSTAFDKLACLRNVPVANLTAAMDASPSTYSYSSLVFSWMPRVDGIFLTENPQVLVAAGKVANVPMINGDCDDEGTLFSLTTLNITTTEQLKEWIQTIWLPQASPDVINKILTLYPDDPIRGSPFDTGALNNLTAQFKRIAAFQGDIVFQAPRRYFLNARSDKQNTWSYVYKRWKDIPVLGSVHSSDSIEIFTSGEMADYLIRFAANLDPSGNTNIPWPKYTTQSPNMMTFSDNPPSLNVTLDTYRAKAIAYLINVTLAYPLW